MKDLRGINPKRIGIFRALQLGDMLCAIPAIRALKKYLPDSDIILIGLPWAKTFVDRYPMYFSGFINFPGFPGLPEQEYKPVEFIKFTEKVLTSEFDLIIQMQGNGSIVNPMVEMFGAKRTAGYFKSGDYCPNNELYMEYPEGLSEIDRHLSLMRFLGIKADGKMLEFPLKEDEYILFDNLAAKYKLIPGDYVVLHPGSRDTTRRWKPENFATIADMISKKGYKVVLTGTKEEKKIAMEVKGLMKYKPIDLVEKTCLGVLTSLIRNAKLLFSNDTGVSHLASATKTKSLVIFLNSDPKRWAPLNKKIHQIILPHEAKNFKYVLKRTEDILMS